MDFPQLLELIICHFIFHQACGDLFSKRNTTRIIGGNEANNGQFPFTVFIAADKYQCAGSILNKNTVITAAHCLYYPESTRRIPKTQIIIYAGNVKQNRNSMKRFSVKVMRSHEDFQPGSQSASNDIAIIRIKREFWSEKSTDPTIQPIELTNTAAPEGKICTVSGWGHYDQSKKSAPTLRYAPVQILNHDECVTRYQRNRITVSEGMTCAASPGVDACLGDSGGPLVCSLDNANRLVGIVSWGIECADKYFPGVYTDVAHYREWISDLMEKIEYEVVEKLGELYDEDDSDSSLAMTSRCSLITAGFLIAILGVLCPTSYFN